MEVIKPKKPTKKVKKSVVLEVAARKPNGPLQVVKPTVCVIPPLLQPPPGKTAVFTPSQITAIRCKLSGMSLAEVGKQMGLSRSSVRNHIEAAKKKLDQNSVLRQALEKKGVSLDKVADVLNDCLGANTTIVTKHGSATNPDHRVRLETAKYVTQLHGAEPAKKIEIEQTTFEQRLVLIAKMEDAEGAACE